MRERDVGCLAAGEEGRRTKTKTGGRLFFFALFGWRLFFFFLLLLQSCLGLVKKRETAVWSRAAAPARSRWLFSGAVRGTVEGVYERQAARQTQGLHAGWERWRGGW